MIEFAVGFITGGALVALALSAREECKRNPLPVNHSTRPPGPPPKAREDAGASLIIRWRPPPPPKNDGGQS